MESHDDPTVAGNAANVTDSPPSVERSLFQHGDRLGRYTVLELLGRGGMGLVYGAYDPHLDRRVAVKVLLSRGPKSTSERARERLLREAQAMAKLSHPNVVAVHDAGTWDGEIFVAMEFVDGPTLRQWLDQAPRSVDEILDVFVQAGRGLCAAHEAGMVHRDFKPTNVLLDEHGHAKVTDFGLVWTAPTPSEPPTNPEQPTSPSPAMTQGGMLGTPAYMAPEQHARGPIDRRADQFGFCVSLFDALFQQHPFPGASVMELVSAVSQGERRPMPTDSTVPAHVRRAVWRGLEFDPQDRWPDMSALLDALLDDPRRRRRRWWIGGAAGLGIVGAMGLTAALTQKNAAATAPPPPCEGAGDEIEEVWSSDRRTAIAEAFESTGQPHAPALWERSEILIDAYVERWRTSARDACEATRVRGEQSDSLFDLRRACLDRRLHDLDSRLRLLREMDDALLDRSFAIATGAAPIDACEDFERLRQTVPPPDDPEEAERVVQLRERLSDLRVLAEAGRDAEIETEVLGLIDKAAQTEYPPLRAEAHALAATVQESLGHWKEAEATLRKATVYAAEGRDDRQLAAVWVKMPYLVGYLQARADDADLLSAVAESALARIDRPRALVFTYEHGMGSVRLRQGDREGARKHYLAALQLTDDGDEHRLKRAAVVNNLAVLRMTDGYYDEARELYERAIELRRGLSRPDDPYFADLQQNLGNIATYLGQLDAALVHFDAALVIARKAEPDGGPRVLANLANRSLVLHELGRSADARADAEQAIAIARRQFGEDHPASMVSWANLARIERGEGKLDAARAALEKATAVALAALGPDHHDLGLFEFERGAVEALDGNAEQAHALMTAALDKLAPAYGEDHPMLAEIFRWRASIDFDRGELTRATAGFQRAISTLERRPGDPRELARARFGLAQCLVKSQPQRAAELLGQARATWSERGNQAKVRQLDAWQRSHL